MTGMVYPQRDAHGNRFSKPRGYPVYLTGDGLTLYAFQPGSDSLPALNPLAEYHIVFIGPDAIMFSGLECFDGASVYGRVRYQEWLFRPAAIEGSVADGK